MGLTQFHHGMPVVVAVSFVSWLGLNASTTCFIADIVEGHEIPPDERLGGCDSIFTSTLRTLTGDTERKPFYDILYDVNFSFLWLLGAVFAAWYLLRRHLLRPQTINHNQVNRN